MAKPDDELTYLQKVDNAWSAQKFRRFTVQSYNWYIKKFQTLGRRAAQEAIEDEALRRGLQRGSWEIGKFYTFSYSAKHAATLPYWDMVPMGCMVGPAKKGFYLLNFHYLPPRYRGVFLDQLKTIANNKSYNENTKLKLTYSLMKSSQKYAMFKPCFHHYLVSRLTSRLILIPGDEWDRMLFLPTQHFQKASNSKVWSDSIAKINKDK